MRIATLCLLLFLGACKQDESCVPPPCQRPNLNDQAQFTIQFCVDSEPDCFNDQDLAVVQLTVKDQVNDLTVFSETYEALGDAEYRLSIGSESEILFGPEPTGSEALDQVMYTYSIYLPNINRTYTLTDFSFVEQEPCDCPRFDFSKVRVNEDLQAVDNNIAVLKK